MSASQEMPYFINPSMHEATDRQVLTPRITDIIYCILAVKEFSSLSLVVSGINIEWTSLSDWMLSPMRNDPIRLQHFRMSQPRHNDAGGFSTSHFLE